MKKLIDRSTCNELGINPKAVYDFIKDGEKNDLGINSFILIKDGKVACEGYYNPFTNDTKQVLYSMSKSITATALGYAINEGKISLDDSISKFFPEYDKNGRNKKVTVRHLVTMTAGKMVPMAKARHDKDWIKIFFDSAFVAKPGKMFMYVNDNFYLLSAIISKVYGETLIDFLTPRLFEPLGIERPIWETDRNGWASGGWGLYMDIESSAKIMLCYANMGEYDGKQVLPREWVEEATKYQVPTVKKGQIDVTKGYGYGFWQMAIPNTYRAYGLFGQSGVVFKDHNTVLMLNSAIAKDENSATAIRKMAETLWDSGHEDYQEKLDELLKNLGDKDDLPECKRNYELEMKYSQKLLNTSSSTFASMLNATITTVHNEQMGYIDRFSLRKDGDDLYMLWKEHTFVNEIKLGMHNEYEHSVIHLGGIDYNAYTKAAWTDEKKLTIDMRIAEACTLRRLVFDFTNEKHIKIRNVSLPDLPTLAAHYVDFSGIVLPKFLNDALIKYIAPAILLIGEPTFYIK